MPETPPLHLRFDAFELDEREARLRQNGQALALQPKVLAVLCALARQPGQLVTKSDLLDAVWGHQFVSDSVLKSAISDLRSVLGDDAKSPRFVETAARRGYRFIASIWSPAAEAPLAVSASPTLVGREPALQRLAASWSAAAEGRRQIVWASGEPGIGKTTLIQAFVASLHGARIAHGQCVEQHGAGEPYLPVLEAVADLCRAEPALAPLLRAVAPTWWLQLPWLGGEAERDTLRRELAGSGPERMLREFGEWLDRCTTDQPLLLITEDLHWSDPATVRLMDHVARRRNPARLMWLASFRPADVLASNHPFKALRNELRLHRLADEIALEMFSEQEVARYLAGRFPQGAVPEDAVRRLHARTDGLPLFLSSLADAGALSGDAPIPESLAGVIEQQITRLSAEECALLEAASVCGVEFVAGVAADGEQAADMLDAVARRQQWLTAQPLLPGSPEGRYAFRHALYRQVFYDRLGALAKGRAHARVAAALAQRQAPAAELALHYELGHDLPAACRQYAAAAQSALAHFAPAEALPLTDRGLALLPHCPPETRRALEMALLWPRTMATSLALAVTAPEARAAFARLDELCEQAPDGSGSALELGLGWSLYVGADYGQALAHARRKLALAEARGDRLLHVAACNLYGATLAYQGRLAEARDWLERGMAEAAELGDRIAAATTVVDLVLSLHVRLSQVLVALGDLGAGREQLAAAYARAEAIHQPYGTRLALIFECFTELWLGDAERVLVLSDGLQSLVTQHAITQASGPARWLRGWALAQRGEPLAGHALILEGYEADVELGLLRGRSGVLGYAAEALVLAGRWDEAQAQLDEAQQLAARHGERLHLPDLHLAQARIEAGRGEMTAAQVAVAQALDEARAQQALLAELRVMKLAFELGQCAAADLTAVRARIEGGDGEPLLREVDALLV